MKKTLMMTLFVLATLAWAVAQQPGSASEQNSGQTAASSPQAGATQTQPSTPGSADQAGSQGQMSKAPITEGCLGGSAPNFTVTDSAGTIYKLNMPPNADTSKLAAHVGESVQVQGDVKKAGTPGNALIDVQAMGRGMSNCPASGSKNPQSPSKQ